MGQQFKMLKQLQQMQARMAKIQEELGEKTVHGTARGGLVEITAALELVMEELGRLPGIGPKTAQRLSFYILRTPRESVDRLAAALTEVKARIRFCNDCFFIPEGEQCTICLSSRRDRTVLCV